MKQPEAKLVPVCSYAEQARPGPRFGIRSEHMAAGNRLPHRHNYFEILSLRRVPRRRGSHCANMPRVAAASSSFHR
jgi:hypothetical protein